MTTTISREARSDRRTTRPLGVPMTGPLLEQWCVNASSDHRDWFSLEERRAAALNFQAQAARRARRNVRIPHGIVIITGAVGAGKSAIANYWSSLFAMHGAPVYHNGPFGYGHYIEDEREWFSSISNMPPGAVLFMDEAASFNRAGRDNADIQGLMIESFTTIRKQEALVIFATAASRRLGPALRQMADQLWRPMKLTVRYDQRQLRRYKREGFPRGKDNPGNFAFGLLMAKDNPYHEPDVFDEILGGVDPRQKRKHWRPDVYYRSLDVKWMRLVAPLLDTFRPVPIGAAMSVNREEVLRIGRGEAVGGGGRDDIYWLCVGQFVRAFSTGKLDIPPIMPAGQPHAPQYYKVSDLHRRISSELSVPQLSKVLREDLRLAPNGNRGYEILELFEAVQAAYNAWNAMPETENIQMPGLDDDQPQRGV